MGTPVLGTPVLGAPVLEFRDISKEYYGSRVLEGINLSLEAGKIHALLGENGAGKSTLMNILFGMPVIHSTGGFGGQVLVEGQPVAIKTPADAMAHGIGMVHQEFMLVPGFAVYENIKLNRENRRGGKISGALGSSLDLLDVRAMRSDSQAALTRVHLDVADTTHVGDLPVGHMQFIEIAREVDKEDIRVLVFDEPTAVLTESEADTLLEVMGELAQSGIAILFITHRLEEVMAIADSVTVLRDGQQVATMPKSETSIEDIAEKMVGRSLEAPGLEKREVVEREKVVLSIKDLHVDMPGERVRGIDLELGDGEILGIGGLAGQGKIGVANGLMGLYPTRGTVSLEGKEMPLNAPRTTLTSGLAFVSEDRRGVGLLLDESIEMNIAIPAMEVRGDYLKYRQLGPLALVDQSAVRATARDMITQLDIRTTGPEQLVRRLSGGNQQKVCLARALVLGPKVLLVSEPTRGIDVGAKKLVLDWLLKLNQEEGLSIIMTSSELAELRSICDRIAIVSEGRVAGVLASDAPEVEFGLLMGGERVPE